MTSCSGRAANGSARTAMDPELRNGVAAKVLETLAGGSR